MRTIKPTTVFRRDYKRVAASPRHRDLAEVLPPLLDLLAADESLPAKHRDHDLTNNWADHRECHIKPDLLLIYRLHGDDLLQLVRLGSHSDLFR